MDIREARQWMSLAPNQGFTARRALQPKKSFYVSFG